MKTHQLLAFILLFFPIYLSAQSFDITGNEEAELLKRKELEIKSVIKYNYRAGDTLKYNRLVYEFDTNGVILSVTGYTKDTEDVRSKTEYHYDDKGRISKESYSRMGNLTRVTNYKYSTAPIIVEEICIDYDEDGSEAWKRHAKKFFNKDSILVRTENNLNGHKRNGIYTYNEKGQRVADYAIQIPGLDTISQTFYTYNDDGSVIRELVLDGIDQLISDERSLYNEDNLIVATRTYNKEGSEISNTEYEYENGLIKRYKTRKYGKTVIEAERFYDPNGNFTFDTMKREYYKYNEMSLTIEKGNRDEDGKEIVNSRYSYIYY